MDNRGTIDHDGLSGKQILIHWRPIGIGRAAEAATESWDPVEARAYPRSPANSAWLARLTEAIIEPDVPIVDPHYYLWDHRTLMWEVFAAMTAGSRSVGPYAHG
jgi:hypothetical protein